MANEITVTASLVATKGTYSFSRKLSKQADLATGRGGNPGVVTIATTDTAIAFGSLVAPRWAVFTNIGATNYVDIGPDSTTMIPFIRLKAGEFAVLPLTPGITIKAKANTAPVDILVEALET
jgi:hypothetical protein